MFGSRKTISGKYSIFRKCYFPERKTFSCVWLSQNSFYGKLILVFGSFKHFTRKCIKSGKTLVRRSEREERRESPDQRERGTIAPRRADERRDRRARRSSDAHRSSIDERCDRPTRDERARRSSIAPLDRRSRSCTSPLVGAARRDHPSLSDPGSLFSPLSLSLSLSLSLFFRK